MSLHRDRAAGVLAGAAVFAVIAWWIYQRGPGSLPWFPGCVFHRITSLDCPGCGMTRATWATLDGDLARAFRLNPLGMILFPIVLLGCALELAGWVRGRPLPFRLRTGAKGGWILFWIIMAYWVLRNLPWWPFTLLAPP